MHGDEETRKWVLQRVRAISQKLDEDDVPTDVLDELVHEAAAEDAAAINNSGVPSQLEFLVRNGWKPEDILGRISDSKEAKEEES